MDEALVRKLISVQFPQWKDLPVRKIEPGGWDHRSFRLGDTMIVRMPSSKAYAAQVMKEQTWLPRLAPHLPFDIPEPLEMGEPDEAYPFRWSVYRYLEGKTADTVSDTQHLDRDLGIFLKAFHDIDPTGGPEPGMHNFMRGGDLSFYDADTREAVKTLGKKIDGKKALEIWEMALASKWEKAPVWVHGDVSLGNLLINEGRLCAVIDFGCIAVGDPACDLAIHWTFLKGSGLRDALDLDNDTWARAKGWTLWKALINATVGKAHNYEKEKCWEILDRVLL